MKENKKEIPEDLKVKIQNRESWFKIAIVVILFGLIAYKIAISDLNFDFSKFEFSDLLSLILAIFSISLSVAFYFKATDTSNKFYDNTYKFTKEISEILGRIEAGFGERLRHLDEGYTGLREKFNGNSVEDKTEVIEAAKKEIEEEKRKIEKEVEEKNEILSSLMKRAKLNDQEKEQIKSQLSDKEEEITNLNNELTFLKRNISRAEKTLSNELSHSIPNSVKEMMLDFINYSGVNKTTILEAPIGYLKKRLKFNKEKYPLEFHRRFRNFGILDENDEITTRGYEMFKKLLE